MFIRFQRRRARLIVSLIETTRVNGKVQQEHLASLGAVTEPPTIADRVAFWAQLHDRMLRLSNRVGADMMNKLIGDIHARVPMATPEDQRALQLENAQTDAEVMASLRGLLDATVAGKRELRAKLDQDIADESAAVAAVDDDVKAALERAAALQRGEAVAGGLGKPLNYREMLKAAGWTNEDIRDCRLLGMVPSEHFDEFFKLFLRLKDPVEKRLKRRAAVATLLKHGLVR